MKNNIKQLWWKRFIQESPYNVGLDSAIFMNPRVWEASGHVGGFSDPLIDCKECKTRHRADKLIEAYDPSVHSEGWSSEETVKSVSYTHLIKEKLNYLFEEYNYSLYQRDSELNKLNFISETLIQLLPFGVVLLASFHYKKGSISVGDIIFFYMLVSYMIEPMFNVIAFIIKKDEILILYERYKERCV